MDDIRASLAELFDSYDIQTVAPEHGPLLQGAAIQLVGAAGGELFLALAETEFKPFIKADWDAFAGCESENPFIGYYGEFTIVIDGDMINIVHGEDLYGGQMFCLKQLA